MIDELKRLLLLYRRPRMAMGEILDGGSLTFAFGAALLVTATLSFASMAPHVSLRAATEPAEAAIEGEPADAAPSETATAASPGEAPDGQRAGADPLTRAFMRRMESGAGDWLATAVLSSAATNVAALTLLYAPLSLLLVTLMEPIGSFGVALRRDFGGLLVCTLNAWSAAFLVPALALLAWVPSGGAPGVAPLALGVPAAAAFLAYMAVALMTVFGARLRTALVTVGVSWLALLFQGFLMFLASPFLAYWAWQFLRGDIGDVMRAFGSRQSFKRHLEAATLNPRDADAHYQLGLIHAQRRQHPQAIERFQAALAVDPDLTDAHYQLGRIARAQSRWEDAIRHLEAALLLDDAHAGHEPWREAGAVYLATGAWEHALMVLERFVSAHPYDPEGLYRLGLAHKHLGHADGARAHFARCEEAARTAPGHLRREARAWARLSRKEPRA